jgi:hypothetical protein
LIERELGKIPNVVQKRARGRKEAAAPVEDPSAAAFAKYACAADGSSLKEHGQVQFSLTYQRYYNFQPGP